MNIIWTKEEKNNPRILEDAGVTYLSYPSLEETKLVRHGFSTRLGGVSEGMYSTMNLSFTRGDKKEAVEENFRRMAKAINVSYESIVCSDQTHTTNVKLVTKKDCGNGITRQREFFDVDGMITNEKGVTLATFYADCVPLFFLDPVQKAIGLSHSGWRGTVGKMAQATILAMNEAFQSNPKDIIVAIGPSICKSCYEVSEDVIEEFKRAYSDHEDIYEAKGNKKYLLDLWKANEYALLEAGIIKNHISMPNLCTCCNSEFLFSHRASKGKRGNLGAFLALSES